MHFRTASMRGRNSNQRVNEKIDPTSIGVGCITG
jgi:hypothetical protein